MTPSDCWIRQSFSRPHDSLTYAAELLTLTGLELHTAAECCNVQTDDGNPYECVCVPACLRPCVFGKRESTGSCAIQHLLRVQLSSFICPLEGKKTAICCKRGKSERTKRACGSRKNKVLQSKETDFAFQKESDCNRKSVEYLHAGYVGVYILIF